MSNLFLIIALWTPCGFWGYYVSSTNGRTSLDQASTIEWLVFTALAIAPWFVITKIQMKDED
jgi:hypothetical protein